MWIIAIDGGGTKCKASLYDPKGQAIATCQTGPANFFADFEFALASINQACEQLLVAANNQKTLSLKASDCFLSMGCAGASIPATKSKVSQWQHPYAGVALTTDIHISCLAANRGKDCALAITGTGSSIAIYQNNTMKQFGGHGFLLGDIASGAWLGKNAVSWFLQTLEKPSDDLSLLTALTQSLGTDANNIVQDYGQAKAAKFASLAPVLLLEKSNSPNVKRWLKEGLDYLTTILQEHAAADTDIFIDGGIAHIYQQALSERLMRPVARPKLDAVAGAYEFAKQIQTK